MGLAGFDTAFAEVRARSWLDFAGTGPTNPGMDVMELTVNIAATTIALAALGLSIYEGRLSRHHDRLSVRPLLDASLRMSPAFERFSLMVVNNGLGPAVVKKWTLLLDKKPYREQGIENWEQLTEKLGLAGPVNYGYFKPGSILATGQCEELVGYPVGAYSKERADQFRAALVRLTICLQYESMYEEKFTFEFDGKVA